MKNNCKTAVLVAVDIFCCKVHYNRHWPAPGGPLREVGSQPVQSLHSLRSTLPLQLTAWRPVPINLHPLQWMRHVSVHFSSAESPVSPTEPRWCCRRRSFALEVFGKKLSHTHTRVCKSVWERVWDQLDPVWLVHSWCTDVPADLFPVFTVSLCPRAARDSLYAEEKSGGHFGMKDTNQQHVFLFFICSRLFYGCWDISRRGACSGTASFRSSEWFFCL